MRNAVFFTFVRGMFNTSQEDKDVGGNKLESGPFLGRSKLIFSPELME